MRELTREESNKRGCRFCRNIRRVKGYKKEGSKWPIRLFVCPFDECPYHELDEHETYDDYLDSNVGKGSIDDLLAVQIDEDSAE